MYLYFNPVHTACKTVTGGVKEGEEFQLNIFCLTAPFEAEKGESLNENARLYGYTDADFVLRKDGEDKEEYYPMEITPFGWSLRLALNETGLYFYHFKIGNEFLLQGKKKNAILSTNPNGPRYQLIVSSADYTTPEWIKGGVMYQIFPDRFYKSGITPDIKGRINRSDWGGIPSFLPNKYGKVLNNDFFGGNFKGIEEKLPYLQSLGVSVVYLNPIFHAKSNHRYDTSDYMQVDPILGSEDDFSHLIESGKQYGIEFILDGVFNHTGDNSVYFNKYGEFDELGAYQSKDSKYYDWYSFEEYPNRYSSWWGIDILPQVNEQSEDYQNFIMGDGGVLKKWLSFGIGGYRLDVADELPDFFLKKLRKSVKESNPNAVVIGEVWEDASNKIAYSERREYLQGEELDSVMNYPLKDAIIRYILTENAEILAETVQMLVDHYPKETLDCLMNILGTHDTARILTVFGGKACYSKTDMAKPEMRLNAEEKGVAVQKLKTASVLQYTLPGFPCVYYGDENGQEGYSDPFCRQCFAWDQLHFELIDHYQKLGEIRKKYKNIFKNGVYQEIYAKNGCIVFQRKNEYGTIFVFVNQSKNKSVLKINGKFKDLLHGTTFENVLDIQEYSYGIFIKNEI